MSNELEKLKYFGDKFWDVISERTKTIIFVIQLMIALLVIASFSERIIPESSLVSIKFLIIFLLFLMPIMLVDYTLKLNDAAHALNSVLNWKDDGKKWYMKLLDGSNYLYTLIVIIVIDSIIQIINQNLINSLLIFLIQTAFIAIIVFSKRKISSK